MKKILSYVSLLTVTTIILQGIVLAAFPDVSSSHPYSTAINYVQSRGIVNGYSDGTYKPDQTISRGEFTKIVIRSRYSISEIEACETTNFTFPDVVEDNKFRQEICMAKKHSIVDGFSDGTYKSDNKIGFGESAKIISNTLGLNADLDLNTPIEKFKAYILRLEEKNAIPQTVTRTSSLITRAEMAHIIYKVNNPGATGGSTSGGGGSSSGTYASLNQSYEVVGIVDGNTIQILVDGEVMTVDLIGIDITQLPNIGTTPEELLELLLLGQYIQLEGDLAVGSQSSSGNSYFYVFLEDGTNFNLTLILEGLAQIDYTIGFFRYLDLFQAAQVQAQAANAGIWFDGEFEGGEETPNPPPYDCSADIYNCGDFASQAEAQNMYTYCRAEVGSDIHVLDPDGDDNACEVVEI